MTIQEANQVLHKVEDEWAYEHLIKAGYKPITKEAKGLVRSFKFQKEDEIITWSVGANANYWRSSKEGVVGGYWGDLLKYLK